MTWAHFHRFIISSHKPILVAAVIATLCAVSALTLFGLKTDYRLEAFVATNDESYTRFRSFMEEFTSNEIALIAVAGAEPYGEAAEAVVASLAAEMNALPAVERCGSLADIPRWIRIAMGDRLLDHPLVAGNLLSTDRRTAALVCQMSGEAAGGAVRRKTVARMKAIVAAAREMHPEFQIILTGPYVTLIDMYAYVNRDLLVFSVLAFVLTVVTMWAVFRRPAPMIYAGAVSACAILCTLGLTIALGVVTSLITQMIVILVIVLSVANCVHLAVATEETDELLPSSDRESRVVATLRRMAAPCCAVMFTTAAGFGAVCISGIAPVRRFGALMVFGLLLALVVSLAGVVVLQRGGSGRSVERPRLTEYLERCARWAVGRRMRVLVGFAVAVAVMTCGANWLRFESDFLMNFRAGSEVRQSYRFVERNLSPLGSMEVVVRRGDGSDVVSAESVRHADELGAEVVDEFEMVKKAMTLADMLSFIVPGLPSSDAEVQMRLAPLKAWGGGERLLRNFVNDAGDALRINFRCVEGFDVDEKLAAAERIEALAAAKFGPEYEVEVTGLYHFYARLVSGLLRDQNRALGLTAIAIFVVMWVMLRDWRLTVIAMIVNLLPVVTCLGAMGWFDIPVNMTTAMMLSVTLGIAVDDTVHYVWRYREELSKGGDVADALSRTHAAVGKACVFTTVVITGGFSILMLSQFLPTAYFGGLVGFTMMVALAADLLLLPALIVLFGSGTSRVPPALDQWK